MKAYLTLLKREVVIFRYWRWTVSNALFIMGIWYLFNRYNSEDIKLSRIMIVFLFRDELWLFFLLSCFVDGLSEQSIAFLQSRSLLTSVIANFEFVDFFPIFDFIDGTALFDNIASAGSRYFLFFLFILILIGVLSWTSLGWIIGLASSH